MLPSQTERLQKLLRSYGMAPSQALAIANEVANIGAAHTNNRKEKDVVSLLYPLKQAIRALQSSRTRWGMDVDRAPLYTKYLRLLLAVRTAIASAWALNLEGLTLTALAKANGAESGGLYWQDWVPQPTKNKVLKAFDALYTETLPHRALLEGKATSGVRGSVALGKRLVPFKNAQKMSASDKRWDMLLASAVSEKEGYKNSSTHIPYCITMDSIIERIAVRGEGEIAPVNKMHLLTPEQRRRHEEWESYVGGARLAMLNNPETYMDADAAQREAQTKKLDAATAKRLRRNEKQKQYMAKRRSAAKGDDDAQ